MAVLALAPAACGVDFVAPDQVPEPPHLFVRVLYEQPVDPAPDESCLRLVMTLTPGHTARGVVRAVERPTARVNGIDVEPYATGGGRVLRYEHRLTCGELVQRLSVSPPVVENSVWPVSPIELPVVLRGGEGVVAAPRGDALTLPLGRGTVADWSGRLNRATWRFSVSSEGPDAPLRQSAGIPPQELTLEAGELVGAPPGTLDATLELEAVGSMALSVPVQSRVELSLQGRVEWLLVEP